MDSIVWYAGNPYRNTRASRLAIEQAENAKRVLAMPEVIYPNGRSSHEAMGQVLQDAEDVLVWFLTIAA